jgi:hypothetical protein
MKHWILFATAIVALVPAASGQQYQRRANITGGGDRDHGKCTVEVSVDGAAEIEIRGDQGLIRNLSGQPAQWRRFECTSPLPANAMDFRFSGVDGRGRQQLLRDPRNGGAAVVRIEDPSGGAEGYTFDITWGAGGYNNPGMQQRVPTDNRFPGQSGRMGRFTTEQAVGVCQDAVRQQAVTRYRGRGLEFRETRIDDNPGRNDWVIGHADVLRGPNAPEERIQFSCSVNFDNGQVRSVNIQPMGSGFGQGQGQGRARRFTAEQAVNACQDSVRQEARERFRGRAVEFRETRMDDNPGRNDWVVGMIEVFRGPNAEERFHFSCSVNFDTGQVRSVDLRPVEGYRQGGSDRMSTDRALNTCRQAVRSRVQRDGYGDVEFTSIRMDDNPGRNDWVLGNIRASRGRGMESFNFSCSVNLRDGEVRSVDVTRR